MTKLTNARKITLASTVGTLAGAALVSRYVKNPAISGIVLGVGLGRVLLEHKAMADAEAQLVDRDINPEVTTGELACTAAVAAVKTGLTTVIVSKFSDYLSRNKGPVVEAAPAPVTPEA